jgi:outer membrane protein TolC
MQPPARIHLVGTLEVELIPLRPLVEVISVGRQNNPRLAQAWAGVTQSQRQYNLANAEAIPDIELGPRYQDVLGEDDDQIGARFAFDLPILNRNEAAIMEAAANTRASRAYVSAAELDSVGEIAAAYQELNALREGLQYYDTRAREVTHETEVTVQDPDVRRLMTGTQALNIRQVLSRLKLQHLELRYRYHRLLSRIEILIGDQITAEIVPTDGEIRFDEEILRTDAADAFRKQSTDSSV